MDFRGVMWPPIDQLSTDGYDLQFGTNCLGKNMYTFLLDFLLLATSSLGHFFFTKLLLPILTKTAQTSNDSKEKVRVITTSSSTHMFHGPGINYETLRESPTRNSLGSKWLYQQSKYVRTATISYS